MVSTRLLADLIRLWNIFPTIICAIITKAGQTLNSPNFLPPRLVLQSNKLLQCLLSLDVQFEGVLLRNNLLESSTIRVVDDQLDFRHVRSLPSLTLSSSTVRLPRGCCQKATDTVDCTLETVVMCSVELHKVTPRLLRMQSSCLNKLYLNCSWTKVTKGSVLCPV